MFGFYLFAAILGGGLLLLSVFGSDHDGGVDHDAPGAHHGAGEILMGFFRPRNLIYFLAAFGLTGTLLTWVGGASLTTLAAAAAMGLAGMSASHALFSWLKRTDSAVDTIRDADLEGLTGRVVLTVAPGESGRVVCVIGDREQYLTARLTSGTADPIAVGRDVVIMSITGGVAEIAPFDALETPPRGTPSNKLSNS